MQRLENNNFGLKTGERLDDLVRNNLKIIQDPGSFCFSIDAVLLANFVTVKKGDSVVDLGTGSGVIPILLTTRQNLYQVIGIEIQQKAVDRAQRSVTGNGLDKLISIEQGDIKEASSSLGVDKFNLVTSNPPYLPIGKGKINPNQEIALARHEISCTLGDVITEGAKLLKSNGRMALVHRPNRMVDIIYLMRKNNLEPKRIQLVYPSVGDKPNMLLIEAVKGSKADLEVMSALYVYDEQGKYTQQILDIYFPKGR